MLSYYYIFSSMSRQSSDHERDAFGAGDVDRCAGQAGFSARSVAARVCAAPGQQAGVRQ
jgi:hypothetical protein